MTSEPEQYPYVVRDPASRTISLAPLLPLTLAKTNSASTWALLDTGAAVSILPYRLGVELGAVWELQTIFVPLSGNLATIEARGLILSARIGNFPIVPLAFAWARTDSVPILLGQMNFFLEFDVCFHRSRASFEVRTRTLPPAANPD